MNFLKRFSFALAFCFAASVPMWGQSAQVVYVATGDSNVYAVTPSGAATQLLSPTTYSGATFTSLTVGPDNTADNANGNTYFFLYACDMSTNNIIRLQMSTTNPGGLPNAVDNVTTAISHPVCGRVGSNEEAQLQGVSNNTNLYSTTSGNLYISSASSGYGVYVITDASSTAVGNTFSAPSPIFGTSAGTGFTGGGIGQKNSGDLLVVDKADNSILKAAFVGSLSASPAAPFSPTLSNFVTSGLSSPNGIARISTGDFFVANQGSGTVLKFNPANLSKPVTCNVSLPRGNVALYSLAASEDNFVYVGIASTSTNKREIQILNGTASNCASTGTPIPLGAINAATVAAVAVPPVQQSPIASLSSSSTDKSTGLTTSIFNFGSSAFQTITDNCTPSAVQGQVPTSYLQNLLNNYSTFDRLVAGSVWPGGTPVPYNGESGFGTLYTITPPSGCNLDANTLNNLLIAALTDGTQFTNPRVVSCDPANNAVGMTCTILDATGTWPSGYIPGDIVGGGTGHAFSQYFLANATLSGELGSFCGFQTPVIQTTDPTTAPIVSGNNLSVKFKLAAQGGNCTNGSYVTDAVALISLAQVSPLVDGQVTMFSPVAIATQGGSTSNPPLFKYNSNSTNYQFSLSLNGLPKGTYALSVTFLSNNAPYQYTFFAIQ